MNLYQARDFQLPVELVNLAETTLANLDPMKRSLTPVMKKGPLGDYGVALEWYRVLEKEKNWVGATMTFNIVYDYYRRFIKGNNRYQQLMVETTSDRSVVGYLRLLHLAQDTPTRRRDCTKIEETIVTPTYDFKDPSLFRFFYDEAARQSEALDYARLVTELGVGYSAQKYRYIARQIRLLLEVSEPDLVSTRERLVAQLTKDWVKVMSDFVAKMDLKITDIVIPSKVEGEITPQIRVVRNLKSRSLRMPAYKVNNRSCCKYRNNGSLRVIREWLNTARDQALDYNGLTINKLRQL